MDKKSDRRFSITTRLTLWYGCTLLCLLSLFAVFSYITLHNSLHHDFDQHLEHEKHVLMPYVHLRESGPAFESLNELRSVAYQTDGVFGTYVRLFSPAGTILYQSPNFEMHQVLPIHLPKSPVDSVFSLEWEGNPARVLFTPLKSRDSTLNGWLELTGFEWSLHQGLHRMGRIFAIGILFSVLLGIAGGHWLASRVLQPVASLNEAANQIRATDLSARLPTGFGVQDELTDLAETFNSMIARLEASFNRERRFTSNAAHELLTPLTTMRSSVEVALRRDRKPEGYKQTLSSQLDDIDQMTETVRGLLQIARAEQLTELPRQPVDFSNLVEQYTTRFQERATTRQIGIHHVIQPEVVIFADENRLGEVIDNLLENALKYTQEGGHIRVKLEALEETARLTVADTGIGFEPEEVEQLFDRFYRSNTRYVQEQAGSGLGLAIVKVIIERYGGTVHAQSGGLNKGSIFKVTLPLFHRDTL